MKKQVQKDVTMIQDCIQACKTLFNAGLIDESTKNGIIKKLTSNNVITYGDILNAIASNETFKDSTKTTYRRALSYYIELFNDGKNLSNSLLDKITIPTTDELYELCENENETKVYRLMKLFDFCNEELNVVFPRVDVQPKVKYRIYVNKDLVDTVLNELSLIPKMYLYLTYYLLLPKKYLCQLTIDMIDFENHCVRLGGNEYYFDEEQAQQLQYFVDTVQGSIVLYNSTHEQNKQRYINGHLFQNNKAECPHERYLRKSFFEEIKELKKQGKITIDFTIDDASKSRVYDIVTQKQLTRREVCEKYHLTLSQVASCF